MEMPMPGQVYMQKNFPMLKIVVLAITRSFLEGKQGNQFLSGSVPR